MNANTVPCSQTTCGQLTWHQRLSFVRRLAEKEDNQGSDADNNVLDMLSSYIICQLNRCKNRSFVNLFVDSGHRGQNHKSFYNCFFLMSTESKHNLDEQLR